MTVIVNELELVEPPARDDPAIRTAEASGRDSARPGPTWGELQRAVARLEARRDRVRAH